MANKTLAQKTNTSSIQVIKTLKVLLQGDYTMQELIEILNKNESDAIFNNSVISKYINTCRFCEFDIPKIHNKYYVAKIPFGLDLSAIDIDLIKSMCAYVHDEMSSKSVSAINSFLGKISRFSNKQIARVTKDKLEMSVELFERAVAKKRKVKLLFKNRETIKCVPLNVSKEGETLFFNVFYKNIRNIDYSRLSGIEMTGQSYINPFDDGAQVVVFKLKGNLAKRYEARPNESVEVNPDGSITITNKNENKEILFSRLLRYDDKCELIRPIAYREEMKELINSMLENYGVN